MRLDRRDDLLQALLDLAAELRAGDERARSRARGCESVARFCGTSPAAMRIASAPTIARLADAGLADEERVVLLPALEDLQEAAHLDVAADDRIEAALAARARSRSCVKRAARRRAAAAVAVGDVARHALQRGHVRAERARPERERLEDDRGRAADLLRERVEQVLDADGPLVGLLLGARRGARASRSRGTRARRWPSASFASCDSASTATSAGSAPAFLKTSATPRSRSSARASRWIGSTCDVLALVGEGLRAGDERLRVGGVSLEVNRLLGAMDGGCYHLRVGRRSTG